MNHVITPDWPAPSHIKAYATLRTGGKSHAPFDSLNLGEHVGDDPLDVQANRDLLQHNLALPSEPIWLEQVHNSVAVAALPENKWKKADASYSSKPEQVCAVMTADCLPILLTDQEGTQVAAIHAGWRGLLQGVIDNTLAKMNIPAEKMLVWLGPAISGKVYEVGDEVRQLFLDAYPDVGPAFVPSSHEHRWLADLYTLARIRFHHQGIERIYGGQYCTYTQKELFFSYRRDGNKTGRNASLIYIAS